MALPLRYNFRNVVVRWRSTLATIGGIALVVAVYVGVQSLAAGLEKSSGNTGDARNWLIVRRGANAESGSQLTREQFNLLRYADEIARESDGTALISPDVVVVLNLPRTDASKGDANVTIRGTGPTSLALRPQVHLVEGRWFTPGSREIVVSKKLAGRFGSMNIGDTLRSGARSMKVVGWFDGGGSAFDSEAWMAVDDVRALFDRDVYSSILLRESSLEAGETLQKRLENEPRLTVHVLRETRYYAEQTQAAGPIKFLGNFLAVMMSVGAVFAAMNTMYASVGARTREIGTLRVLGFRRRSVLFGILLEGGILALIGGVLGCAIAFQVNGITTGTIGFESFSEIVFQFQVTPQLVAKGLVFSFVVGVLGSLLPALRASRLPVISALKSV